MSTFEYFATFISFMVAYSLIKVVSDGIRVLQTKPILSRTHTTLILIVLLFHIQAWLGFAREFHSVTRISATTMTITSLAFMIMVAVVELLIPEVTDKTTPIDLRSHYWSNSRSLNFAMVIYLVMAAIVDALGDGELVSETAMSFRILGIIMLGILIVFPNKNQSYIRHLHFGIHLLLLGMLLTFTYQFSNYIELTG